MTFIAGAILPLTNHGLPCMSTGFLIPSTTQSTDPSSNGDNTDRMAWSYGAEGGPAASFRCGLVKIRTRSGIKWASHLSSRNGLNVHQKDL
jgi:hypothetical protein